MLFKVVWLEEFRSLLSIRSTLSRRECRRRCNTLNIFLNSSATTGSSSGSATSTSTQYQYYLLLILLVRFSLCMYECAKLSVGFTEYRVSLDDGSHHIQWIHALYRIDILLRGVKRILQGTKHRTIYLHSMYVCMQV